MELFFAPFYFFFFCTFTWPSRAFEWTNDLPDGSQRQACEGDTVTFSWGVRLSNGERVDSFDHHRQLAYVKSDNSSERHHGDSVDTEIVTSDRRFTFGPEYQLQISNIRVNDTGNYTFWAKVKVSGKTDVQTYRNIVSLTVNARPELAEEGFRARQLPQVVKVTNGSQPGWHVKLSCGTFLSLGHPAVTAIWTTPSGTQLPSSSFENGGFSLMVPNPVDEGLYQCHIDPKAPALTCADPTLPLWTAVHEYVDRAETRIMFLEAENRQPQTEMLKMTNQNTELKSTIDEMKAQESGIQSEMAEMKHKIDGLQSKMAALRTQNSEIEAKHDEMQSRVGELMVENDKLQAAVANLTLENRDLRLHVSELKNQTDMLQSETSELRVENARLQSRLKSINTVTAQLKSRIDEAVEQNEKQQVQIRNISAQNTELQSKMGDLKNRDEQLQTSVNSTIAAHRRLVSSIGNLTAESNGLKTNVENLQADNRLLMLKDSELKNTTLFLDGQIKRLSRQVSFYARVDATRDSFIPDAADPSNLPLVLRMVLSNEGNAYNSTTGTFTAPYDGTYFFAATAGGYDKDKASLYVKVDKKSFCYTSVTNDRHDSHESSTCTVTVRLRAGQTVWLKNGVNSRHNFMTSTFAGFLINSDP